MNAFLYITQLEFASQEILPLIAATPPDPEMIALGSRFREQILSAYLPKSSVKFINQAVGYGLFADEEIAEGAFVCEYMGVVRKNDQRNELNNYLYRYPVVDNIGRSYVIDGGPKSTLSRFINHSYTPNLRKAFAYVDGLFHAVFTAAHTIAPGAQLCFDYGQTYWYLRGPPEDLP